MLHLTAFDADDLQAISANLQDAVIRRADMAWQPQRRQFAMVANRFAWDALPHTQRRRSGVHFNYVTRVRQNMPESLPRDGVLSLLSVAFEPAAGDGISGTVMLAFSGGHRVALDVECLDVQLDDLGPAWAARNEPHHDG